MPDSSDPRRDSSSTYFIRDYKDERTRIQIQDNMLTAGMGGVLPEQPDPTSFKQILDIGCGTGDWLLEIAKAYPGVERLIGVDINERMVEYAQAQSEAQSESLRIQFRVMDARGKLDFPDTPFDLVNQRFATGYLRKEDWPVQLQKYRRLARPGGVIRITEANVSSESNSQALTALTQLLLQAFWLAGHFFTPASKGILGQLAPLLQEAGLRNVQTRAYALEFRAGTVQVQHFSENIALAFRGMKPFLQKWGQLPDNYEETYQQMLHEMQQPDFTGTMHLLTAWGTVEELD